MRANKSILLATVGGQPQVLTFALDGLLEAGESISEVHLVYLKPVSDRIARALDLLFSTLESDPRYTGIAVVKHVVEINGEQLSDVRQTADASFIWEFISHKVTELKRAGYHLNVLVSGGRLVLGLLTMSAAALHFYPDDKLWHIYTPDEILPHTKDGKMLHLPKDTGFQLVEVPMFPLGSLFVGLRDIPRLDQKRAFFDSQTDQKCRAVLDQLTRRQRDVLLAFADGQRPADVAKTLSVSLATVDTHKSQIFKVCREVWEMDLNTRLDYRFLVDTFYGYV